MGVGERVLDYCVTNGAEFAQRALWKTAKVQTLASVLGIGTTSASLAIMAADHAPEIAKAANAIAQKLVRKFPNR